MIGQDNAAWRTKGSPHSSFMHPGSPFLCVNLGTIGILFGKIWGLDEPPVCLGECAKHGFVGVLHVGLIRDQTSRSRACR
jgi:hypothetical protein